MENEYGLHVGGTKSGVTYDVAEPLQKEDRGAKIKPGMWRRKGRRNRNKGLSTGNFISMIKAQFAEVCCQFLGVRCIHCIAAGTFSYDENILPCIIVMTAYILLFYYYYYYMITAILPLYAPMSCRLIHLNC